MRKRWLLATSLLVAATAAHAQDLSDYHLTLDQNFGANGISAGPPGSGKTWETSVAYGDLSTGNNGTVNPTDAAVVGSQYSMSPCALDMAITPQHSPYLDTAPSFAQQYGYFEASIKQAPNDWNAFWLLPKSGPWPPEIDILEGSGSDAELTNHGGDINTPVNNLNIYNRPDLSTSFHTYGLMWTPTTLTWYLDGKAVFSAPTASNEQQPMMIILSAYNQGNPNATAMQVAWVRAYSNDPNTKAISPAPAGNCPETGGAQSNALLAAAAAAGYSIVETPAQAAQVAAAVKAGQTVVKMPPVNQAQLTPAAPPLPTTPVCGEGTHFTVTMDGKQLGNVRSATGLTTADLPRSYTTAGHSVVVQLFSGDGTPMASCQSGTQQAAVQTPLAKAHPAPR